MATSVAHPLRVGFMFRPQRFPVGIQRRVWRNADDAGFDHIWGFDHLFAVGDAPATPVFDGWTLLGAMAEVTRHARIGLMVTGNLYRHPGMLAKVAVTVDHLSGGRLEMGLGAGWQEPEFRMMGMPFPGARERIERLDEACDVLKLLWTADRATFTGSHYQLVEAIAEPKPLQRPHPPLWIGGSGPKRTLRVVAKHADVWNASVPSLAANVASSRLLDEHCAAIGRDPSTIRRSVQLRWAAEPESVPSAVGDLAKGADLTCHTAEAYVRAGFTELVFMISLLDGDIVRIADVLGEVVLPRMRALGPMAGD